jgi:hypothetical protein
LRKGYDEISSAALTWNPQGSWKRKRPKTNWRRIVEKEYCKILERYEKGCTK